MHSSARRRRFTAQGVIVERVVTDSGCVLPLRALAPGLGRHQYQRRQDPTPADPKPTAESDSSTGSSSKMACIRAWTSETERHAGSGKS
jgi:hypothetical protein